jgi:phage/plasmid-like protein (TIGR03299 family)
MAHQITKTDKVIVNQRQAWHGLAEVLPEAPNVWTAMQKANLGWKVDIREISYDTPTGPMVVPDRLATVRSDTQDVLGIVSKSYRVCQNVELAGIIDGLGKAVPKIESAGSLRGGRDVFLLARLGSFKADDAGLDQVDQYMLFSNAHDGTGALGITPTTVRVVCKNTLEAATSARGAMHVVRHVQNLSEQLKLVADHILSVVDQHATFAEAVSALSAKKMSKDQLQEYFAQVFVAIEGKQAIEREREKMAAKAERVIAEWQKSLIAEDNLIGRPNTAWAALNAVTHWADHTRKNIDPTWSKLMGPARDVKLSALGRALALVK